VPKRKPPRRGNLRKKTQEPMRENNDSERTGDFTAKVADPVNKEKNLPRAKLSGAAKKKKEPKKKSHNLNLEQGRQGERRLDHRGKARASREGTQFESKKQREDKAPEKAGVNNEKNSGSGKRDLASKEKGGLDARCQITDEEI